MQFFRRPQPSVVPSFALDIADDMARLVELDQPQRQGIPVKTALAVPLAPGLVENGMIRDVERTAATLHEMLVAGRHRLPRFVVASLPDTQTYVLTVTIAKADQTDLAESVPWEVVQHVPFRVEELSMSWKRIKEEREQSTYQVSAAPKTLVDAYAAVLERAGLVPIGFEVAALAGLRSLTLPNEPFSIALIIGWSSSTLLLVSADGIPAALTASTFSGSRLTAVLMNQLKLKPRDAARALTVCGLDPQCSRGVVRHALWPELKELLNSLEQLDAYREDLTEKTVGNIILTGSHSRIKAFGTELHEKTRHRVYESPLQPFVLPTVHGRAIITDQELSGFVTAFGLALANV